MFHFRITGNRPAQHDMEDSLPEFTPLFNKYVLFITKVIYFFLIMNTIWKPLGNT